MPSNSLFFWRTDEWNRAILAGQVYKIFRDIKSRTCVLILLWLILFSPVAASLCGEWISHSDNSHGFLVPLISLYFVWSERGKLNQIALASSSIGAVLLVICLIIYVVSYAGDIAFTARLMMVFSLFCIILFNFGFDIVRLLLFPLLFLLFMIPIPVSFIEKISIPMQLFASSASAYFIKLLSIPVYQEGNILYFSQTQLEVAQACSGLRSIVSLIMLSVIFAYLFPKSMIKKLILLMSAIPIALFANIARVTGTGILSHFYGSVMARGFLHDLSGLIVFVFGFMALLLEFFFLSKIGKESLIHDE